MTSEGKRAADGELLRLIYLHLKQNGYKKAANVLKKQGIQKEIDVQTTLLEIYVAWTKTKREREVEATPARKAGPPGCTREAEAEAECETGAAFQQVVGSDAASRHPVVTGEMRSSDGDSEEDAAVQKSSVTAQAKAKCAGPSKAETLTPTATAKPISSTTGPEAAESASESDSEDGLPPTQIAVVTSVTAGLAGAVTRTPAVEMEAESSQMGSSRAETSLQEPANIPRATPATQSLASLCTPLLPEAVAWPPAEGEARASDVGSSAESGSIDPATLQACISQPSATPEVTSIGETSDSDCSNSDRGNADAREGAAVQTPSTGGTVAPVKPLRFLSTPVLPGATRRTPAVEQEARSLRSESSAESGAEDRAAQQKTLVAPKAKPLPAAPRAAVRSTCPPLVQPPSGNPGPSRAPADTAGGSSELQSEDGLPLTQEAPLTPNPQPVGLTSSSSASSSSISTQKSSVLIKKEEGGSADSSCSEDGATRSTPAVGRGPGCWDTEGSAESGAEDQCVQQTVTAATKLRSKRTLAARTRNLLKIIDKICGGPVSLRRNETLLAVSPKVSSSKSKSQLTKDEEETASVTVKASEVAPPTEQEAICSLKISTGEAKRKRHADKMDPPAKKKKKKRARCSEGRGGGAKSDRSQGEEKQETWTLTLSDSDTSKEHPMASVNTAPTLSGEKKWRRTSRKKVKAEDVENGMSESTWKMEKVTPGKAKGDYPSEASQELASVSRKTVRKSSSLKRALVTLDTTSRSSKKRKKSDEGVTSKPRPGNKTKVLKKKVKKDKQAEAGRKGKAGSLSALLGVKRREKNQIKQKNRKRKKMKANHYWFLLDRLSPMRTSPEPD